ncbi:MAG: glycosyltransferase family 4 protein [Thermodesulfobacteriota bacterium]|nr:glycosyltransferase family 4 protein [Thermodesulfobacteriota bacterium]
MKILFVNEKCGFFGGVEQNIADTVEGLRVRGHACYLAYGEISERDLEQYMALFAETFLCREMASITNDGNVQTIDDILGRVSPDVIYFHKIPELKFYMHLLERVHTVRMIHDHDLCCPRRHKYFISNGRVCHHRLDWRCWIDGAFIARSNTSRTGFAFVNIREKLKEMRRNYRIDSLLVGSRFMRDELLQNGFPKEKVHILPPVIRMENRTPSPVPTDPVILYVGQLIRGKGVDLLLHALQNLPCNFRANIVGTGNAELKLKALCTELGLNDRVHFSGWVRNEDLGQFYSEAKVLVVPSRWPEPFGMIGLEAMHHGRPVIAFGVGGIPDWLEHQKTGLIVREQDVSSLAKSLERVLTEPGLASKLGQNGLQRVRTKYSFELYIDRLILHLGGDNPLRGEM